MGGCVGKPKEFDAEEAPIEAPAVEKVEAETIQEVKYDGDDKKEEPLVDTSEPPKAEEAKTAEAETEPVEDKAEAVEEAPKEEEANKVAETA